MAPDRRRNPHQERAAARRLFSARRCGTASFSWRCMPGSSSPRKCAALDPAFERESPVLPTPLPARNLSGFSSPEMDRIIDAARKLRLDSKKAAPRFGLRPQRLYCDRATLAAALLPLLPCLSLPKWLSGLHPTGNQYPTTLWIHGLGRLSNGREIQALALLLSWGPSLSPLKRAEGLAPLSPSPRLRGRGFEVRGKSAARLGRPRLIRFASIRLVEVRRDADTDVVCHLRG